VSDAPPCLLDTNVVAWIRDNHLNPVAYVGSGDLAVSETVLAELQGPMPLHDPKMQRNLALIAAMGGRVVATTDEMQDVAEQIEADYQLHQPPPGDDPADALIAAEAIVSGRVLVTRNWKHFHYIRGLRLVDARRAATVNLIDAQGIEQGTPRSCPCCLKVP
jgi:predicted nucleic acid-binding protein